jgi:NAD(P)H-quinone oxidoreductase subunit 5
MMLSALQLVPPLLAPAALVGVAWTSFREPGLRPHRTRRALLLAGGAGIGAAVLTIALYALGGPFTAGLPGLASVGAVIRVDGLSVVLFTMVTLLVAVIGRFSATYLDGDERHGRFLGGLAATAASVEVLILADHLLLFWLAWVATSVCLDRLLVSYRERPRAVAAARKARATARLGDGLLAVALILLYRAHGTGSIEEILAIARAGDGTGPLAAAAFLMAVIALLKAAQFPTHGWLVEVMETPTPVSALLHAGILNAGPFLILRFAPLMEQAPAASMLLVVVGGFTAAFASVVLRTQPAVKVSLGYSSAAHMGFTLFVCGLGVYAAAALHLVAHSFYKAHAFLSAGSVVEATQASRVVAPPRRRSAPRVALALAVATATYLGVAWAMGMDPAKTPSLFLVGAVIVAGLTQLVGAALDADSRPVVHLQVVMLAGVTTAAFFGLEELARLALRDALPQLSVPAPSVLAVGGAIVAAWGLIVATQLLGWGRDTRFAQHLRVHLRHGLYANAWFDRLVAARTRLFLLTFQRASHS